MLATSVAALAKEGKTAGMKEKKKRKKKKGKLRQEFNHSIESSGSF